MPQINDSLYCSPHVATAIRQIAILFRRSRLYLRRCSRHRRRSLWWKTWEVMRITIAPMFPLVISDFVQKKRTLIRRPYICVCAHKNHQQHNTYVPNDVSVRRVWILCWLRMQYKTTTFDFGVLLNCFCILLLFCFLSLKMVIYVFSVIGSMWFYIWLCNQNAFEKSRCLVWDSIVSLTEKHSAINNAHTQTQRL